ncbi:MAG: beta-N-acetylglucosaminidase domain-containing protein [Acidobacteriota bacterium]
MKRTASPDKFVFAAVALAFGIALLAVAPARPAPNGGPEDAARPCRLKIVLPASPAAFPEPYHKGKAFSGFEIRGTKGWAWTPAQYLAEIPYLPKFKMNFLMNCYLSMFSDPEKLINRWWEPIPAAKKKAYERVVRACRERGITFCFAIHPQLFSAKPLRYDNEEDFDKLWQHFAWMQGLGVGWFSLSFDDITVEGQDKAWLGQAQARLVNKLLAKLRKKDSKARMILCPVYYWGDGTGGDAAAYLGALARVLDPEALVFWTGDGVVTREMTVRAAQSFRSAVRHGIVIWDNYPVNDRSGALHLGPLAGREAKLAEVAEGYMSNPHAPQNEINRIPLATCADYAYNPRAYDPARSIGQVIAHLADKPGRRAALKDLVELSPGDLACGVPRTGYDSILEEFNRILSGTGGREEAQAFIARVEDVARRLEREFPDKYLDARKTLRNDIARLRERLARLASK